MKPTTPIAAMTCLLLAGCPATEAPKPPATPPPPPGAKKPGPPNADTRFMKIRRLLEKPPQDRERAENLYGLVKPICDDEKERKAFIETAKWSAGFSTKELYITKTLAADVIEHVATACFRSQPAATYALLDEAKLAIPDFYRFDLMRARLAASASELEIAEQAAKAAQEGGSIHAIALLANIQAQRARQDRIGYEKGMLDVAIQTVSVEPDGQWPLVDLAAVLSTRARLLTERAVWEEDDAAKKTMLLANQVYQRLSVPPFIENIRTRAEDVHCFNAIAGGLAPEPCKKAGTRAHHLGAAAIAGVDPTAAGFDVARLKGIRAFGEDLKTLTQKKVVVLVFRGDESELLEWARPTARVLKEIAQRKAQVVVVDRTKAPRAKALVKRILALGGIAPTEMIDAQSTFAMPCVTAVLAQRQTPKACPFTPARVKKLEKMTDFGFAILVGRDLDAEIDDLHLYELKAILMSFRASRMEKGIDAWLKSVSDVWLVAPPS